MDRLIDSEQIIEINTCGIVRIQIVRLLNLSRFIESVGCLRKKQVHETIAMTEIHMRVVRSVH